VTCQPASAWTVRIDRLWSVSSIVARRAGPPRYAPPITEIRVLGPLEAATASGALEITEPRERVVLAVLAMSPGRPSSVERLADALWSDAPPASSVKIVQNVVLRLRKALGREAIRTTPGGYVLADAGLTIDARELERLADEARAQHRAGRYEAAASGFAAAGRRWRGRPLPELEDWAPGVAEAHRLQELHAAVVEDRFEAELAAGHPQRIVAELEVLVAEEPLRERRWGLLATALDGEGRRAEALRALQRARTSLAEVGLEPGPELRALERAISADKDALEGPISGREAAAPPRQPSPTEAVHLPRSLTSFVGRAREVTTIAELLTTARVVTLSGAAGVGKTRLALEVAASGDLHADAWFAELAPVTDPAGVPGAVGAALGVFLVSGLDEPDALAPIVRALAARRAVVVLDNCEHLAEAVGRLAVALLHDCPDLRILATSREPLGVPGEAVYVIPPMSLPPEPARSTADVLGSDAGALFCERARATSTRFVLDDRGSVAVASICRRLDGIPLAIELAAAWVRMLSVQEIEQRVGHSLDLLKGGPRTARPHHQTMRAALDWSYGLLDDGEQRAVRWLSVFPDQFDLDAAAELLERDDSGAGGSGLELVVLLVDKSLVVVLGTGEQTSYRMLVPVAQFARAKLAGAGETEAAIRRHDTVFASRAEQAFSAHHPFVVPASRASYLVALDRAWQAGDLRRAKLLVLAQSFVWGLTGDPLGVTWLERVAAGTTDDPVLDSVVLAALASMLHVRGVPTTSRRRALLEQAIELGRGTDAERGALWALGDLERLAGNLDRARSIFSDLRDGHVRHDRWEMLSVCEERLGWVSVAEGRFDEATSWFTSAETNARRGGNEWVATMAAAATAPLRVDAGQQADGLAAAEAATTAARRIGDTGLVVLVLRLAAEAAVLAEDDHRARRYLGEAATDLRRTGNRLWLADVLETGAALAEAGNPRLAATLLGAGGQVREAAGEQLGGQRVLSGRVRSAPLRLAETLDAADLADALRRGHEQPTAASLDELLAWMSSTEDNALIGS
jgi:predicted ATPase/DNA-binding SARP family transcriptional activator